MTTIDTETPAGDTVHCIARTYAYTIFARLKETSTPSGSWTVTLTYSSRAGREVRLLDMMVSMSKDQTNRYLRNAIKHLDPERMDVMDNISMDLERIRREVEQMKKFVP